jgi:hypothetical protein
LVRRGQSSELLCRGSPQGFVQKHLGLVEIVTLHKLFEARPTSAREERVQHRALCFDEFNGGQIKLGQ